MPPSRHPVADAALIGRWLRQSEDLRGLPGDLLDDLAAHTRWEVVESAEPWTVYDFDQPPEGLYLVRLGEFQATRRQAPTGKPRLYTFRRGHVFGEEALFPVDQATDRLRVDAPSQGGLALWPTADVQAYRARVAARAEAGDPVAVEWRRALERTLEGMALVQRHAPLLVERLRRAQGAASLSESQLRAMLEGAELVRLDADSPPVLVSPFGAPPPNGRGLYLLLDGEARVTAVGEHTSGHVLHPDVHPLFDTEQVADALTLTADVSSTLIRVPSARIEKLLRRSTAYRRRVLADTFPSSPLGRRAREHDQRSMQAIALCADDDVPLPFEGARLAEALADSMARQFGDQVKVVHVRDVLPPGATAAGGFVDAAEVERVGADVQQLWRAGGAAYRYDYVVVDLIGAGRALRSQVAPAIDTWLRLTDTASLADIAVGVDDDGEDGLDPLAVEVPVFLVGAGRDSTARLTLAHPLRSIRLRCAEVPLDQQARGLPVAQAGVDRLARAATDRLVGVALGGGGALGLAHVPLLRAIDEAGIPIDIVSGASFGSLVGAYYCMDGCAGLDRLERNVRALAGGWSVGGFILPQAVLRLIDQPMKQARLESLPVQFVPVATYASDFTPALPAAASVAEAVRASGAMPPLFAAHDGDGTRFLDGAFVANVPAEVLVACGAALVIASDPISQPAAEAARQGNGRLARAADAVGRLGVFRLTDLGRGLQTLVHLASAQSSLTGDVLFRPPRASLLDTFRFGHCADIIDASQQAIERTGFVRRAQAAWGQLRGHERVVPQTLDG